MVESRRRAPSTAGLSREALGLVEEAFERPSPRALKRHVGLRARVVRVRGEPLERLDGDVGSREIVQLEQVADLPHARRQLELRGPPAGVREPEELERHTPTHSSVRSGDDAGALPVSERVGERRAIADPARHRDRFVGERETPVDLGRPVQRHGEPRQQACRAVGCRSDRGRQGPARGGARAPRQRCRVTGRTRRSRAPRGRAGPAGRVRSPRPRQCEVSRGRARHPRGPPRPTELDEELRAGLRLGTSELERRERLFEQPSGLVPGERAQAHSPARVE